MQKGHITKLSNGGYKCIASKGKPCQTTYYYNARKQLHRLAAPAIIYYNGWSVDLYYYNGKYSGNTLQDHKDFISYCKKVDIKK